MLERRKPRLGTLDVIPVAVVADRETTRGALLALMDEDAELVAAGEASSPEEADKLLASPDVRVILVSLPLSADGSEPPRLAFIRHAKKVRPDIGIVSLKRDVDEHRLRAALDAGADACCMVTTPQTRLVQAIKAVAAGATWLDPEISKVLLHPSQRATGTAAPRLSPREEQILRLLTHGYTNEEIALRIACAPATVKTHLLHLFRKLGVRDRVSAAVAALRAGIF